MKSVTCAGALIALAAAWTAALAQYSNSDPRSPMYQEHQRQEREKQQEKDKADDERRAADSARSAENYKAFMDNQRKLQEKLSGDVERDRALFLKTPPIPPQKNTLLGQWRLDRTKKKPANEISLRSTRRFRSGRARWCSATAFGTSGRKRSTASMPASASRS